MRVVQLGCGITGLVCAEELSKNAVVDEVVLADSRVEAASAVKKRVGSRKLRVQKVDGRDSRVVKDLLKGSDLAIGSMPWGMNGLVLDTAIKLGINYVDFSMVAPKLSEFNELSKRCRAAGITAMTAAGEDPGISDCFAVWSAGMLDSADEARVYDGDSGSAEGHEIFSSWSPVDLFQETTVPAAVFVNGKMTYLPPLDEREIYEFPPPIGPLPVYKTLHEETFLMPRYIRGLRNASFRIAIDDNFAHFARTMRKIGMHGDKPIDVKGVKVRPLDVVAAMLPRPVDLSGKIKGFAAVVVEVEGKKDGKRTKIKTWTLMSHERAYELCRSNSTGYLVGVGGAIASEMVLEGAFNRKGLSVPEHLPAAEFITRLKAKGLKVEQEFTQI